MAVAVSPIEACKHMQRTLPKSVLDSGEVSFWAF